MASTNENDKMTDVGHTEPAPAGVKTITVHKAGEEGGLIIDAHTGIVRQPLDERPMWAEGLSCALIAERLSFYTSRLGPQWKDASPDVLEFADLGWIAADAEGTPIELEADAEHRMTVLAEILGVDRDQVNLDAPLTGKAGEELSVVIEMNNPATPEDVTAFEEAQQRDFEEKTGTEG